MTNFIIAAIVLIIIGAAVAYIVKEKKRGVKCIGCPAGASCAGRCNSQSGCSGCHADKKRKTK